MRSAKFRCRPITRANAAELEADKIRYQTVFAKPSGSVAAPTAGLHFTEKLLAEIRARGVQVCFVTLHVGLGTFAPVKSDTLDGHTMHEERYELSEETARLVNDAKAAGRRVVAVGTTTRCGCWKAWRQLHGGRLVARPWSHADFYLSAARVSNRGRAADEFSFAALDVADTRERLRRPRRNARTRIGIGRLRQSRARTVSLLQIYGDAMLLV